MKVISMLFLFLFQLATVAGQDCQYFDFTYKKRGILNPSPPVQLVFQNWKPEADTIVVDKSPSQNLPFGPFEITWDTMNNILNFKFSNGPGSGYFITAKADDIFSSDISKVYFLSQFEKKDKKYHIHKFMLHVKPDTFFIHNLNGSSVVLGYDDSAVYFGSLASTYHHIIRYGLVNLQFDTISSYNSSYNRTHNTLFINKEYELRPRLVSSFSDHCGTTLWFSLNNLKGSDFEVPIFSYRATSWYGYPTFINELWGFKYCEEGLYFASTNNEIFKINSNELQRVLDLRSLGIQSIRLVSFEIKNNIIFVCAKMPIQKNADWFPAIGKTINGLPLLASATDVQFYFNYDLMSKEITYP